MATNYQRGRAAEYKTISMLEAVGYTCTRAASSKGLFDVVGVRFDGTRCIQTKLMKKGGSFSEDENCKLSRELVLHPSTIRELWLFESGQGLVEIRDLDEPPFDARTAAGRAAREVARQRARDFKAVVKAAKKRNA